MSKPEPPIIKVPFELKEDQERGTQRFIIDRDYIEIFSHRNERASRVLKFLQGSDINHCLVPNQIIIPDVALNFINNDKNYVSLGNLDNESFINFTQLAYLIREINFKLIQYIHDRFAITLFKMIETDVSIPGVIRRKELVEESGFDTIVFDLKKQNIYIFPSNQAISNTKIDEFINNIQGAL